METITSQLKLQIPSFMGVRSRKYCAPKPPGSLHILISLDPEKIDQSALRYNSRNNIHSERGFVLQINLSRQHRFFILKKILGSIGATGAQENTLVGGRIIRFSDNDTNSKQISYSGGHQRDWDGDLEILWFVGYDRKSKRIISMKLLPVMFRIRSASCFGRSI
jgi:hypothetical protein